MATLGIVGGLGPESTIDYYRRILELWKRDDPSSSPSIIIDSLDQKAVLRWLKEVGTSSPDAQMEVVMYAKGFELVMPERSAYIADVKEAMKNSNVTFKVCAIALKNNNVNASQLLPGVQTVPDGIYELVSKQQDHWGYIKVMH